MKYLNFGYYKYNSKVYYKSGANLLETIYNPNSIKILSESFVISDNILYYEEKELLFSDKDTFQVINHIYSMDKNQFYSFNSGIEHGFDLKSLVPLDEYYLKDENGIYLVSNQKLLDVDYDTFEVLGNGYSKDKNSVYYLHFNLFDIFLNRIEQNKQYENYIDKKARDLFHLKTIKSISKNFLKDKNRIYFFNTLAHGCDEELIILDDVDYNSFKVVDNFIYKDKNDYYFEGVYGSCEYSFNIFNLNFVDIVISKKPKNENESKRRLKLIEDRIKEYNEEKNKKLRFEDFTLRKRNLDGINDTRIWIGGKYFQTVEGIFYRDSKYELKQLKCVDLDSFKVLNFIFGRDKNNFYFKDEIIKELPNYD